jgi:hypothetical protein
LAAGDADVANGCAVGGVKRWKYFGWSVVRCFVVVRGTSDGKDLDRVYGVYREELRNLGYV